MTRAVGAPIAPEPPDPVVSSFFSDMLSSRAVALSAGLAASTVLGEPRFAAAGAVLLLGAWTAAWIWSNL